MNTRRRLRRLGIASAAALAVVLVAACSSGGSEDGAGSGATTSPTVAADSSDRGGGSQPMPEPDCVSQGYPCDIGETPPELVTRTMDLLNEAGEELARGGMAAALSHIQAQSDVVDAFGTGRSITFRVNGAAAAWLIDSSGVGAGAATSNRAPTRTRDHSSAQAISVVGEDTSEDGEIDNRDAKRALVLAPYMWDFAPLDESDLIAERLETMTGYEGNVTFRANRSSKDRQVTVDDWAALDRYDAIFISTHGARQCRRRDDGTETCRTVVLTGIEISQQDVQTSGGVYTGFFPVGLYSDSDGQTNLYFELGVDTGFLQRRFPDGLDNTLLSLSACETGLISGDEFAAAAGGDNFVMMAWTEVVPASAAFNALGTFIEQLSLGLTSEQAYGEVIDRDFGSAVNSDGLVTAFEHISPQESELRLVELPTLVDDGEPMSDGERVSHRINGTPGDEEPDGLRLDLKLVGIDEPERFRVRYEVDGQRAVGTYGLERAEEGDLPYTYTVTHDVELGFDLPVGQVNLSAVVLLPEGGESRFTVTVNIGDPAAVITIGGEIFEFELTGFLGSSCQLSPDNDNSLLITDGATPGDPEGPTFSAHLEPGGQDVPGLFSVHGITVVDPATDREFMADHLEYPSLIWLSEIPDGGSQIDEVTIEDGHAWGKATFYDVRAAHLAWLNNEAPPTSVGGTFDITCG